MELDQFLGDVVEMVQAEAQEIVQALALQSADPCQMGNDDASQYPNRTATLDLVGGVTASSKSSASGMVADTWPSSSTSSVASPRDNAATARFDSNPRPVAVGESLEYTAEASDGPEKVT